MPNTKTAKSLNVISQSGGADNSDNAQSSFSIKTGVDNVNLLTSGKITKYKTPDSLTLTNSKVNINDIDVSLLLERLFTTKQTVLEVSSSLYNLVEKNDILSVQNEVDKNIATGLVAVKDETDSKYTIILIGRNLQYLEDITGTTTGESHNNFYINDVLESSVTNSDFITVVANHNPAHDPLDLLDPKLYRDIANKDTKTLTLLLNTLHSLKTEVTSLTTEYEFKNFERLYLELYKISERTISRANTAIGKLDSIETLLTESTTGIDVKLTAINTVLTTFFGSAEDSLYKVAEQLAYSSISKIKFTNIPSVSYIEPSNSPQTLINNLLSGVSSSDVQINDTDVTIDTPLTFEKTTGANLLYYDNVSGSYKVVDGSTEKRISVTQKPDLTDVNNEVILTNYKSTIAVGSAQYDVVIVPAIYDTEPVVTCASFCIDGVNAAPYENSPISFIVLVLVLDDYNSLIGDENDDVTINGPTFKKVVTGSDDIDLQGSPVTQVYGTVENDDSKNVAVPFAYSFLNLHGTKYQLEYGNDDDLFIPNLSDSTSTNKMVALDLKSQIYVMNNKVLLKELQDTLIAEIATKQLELNTAINQDIPELSGVNTYINGFLPQGADNDGIAYYNKLVTLFVRIIADFENHYTATHSSAQTANSALSGVNSNVTTDSLNSQPSITDRTVPVTDLSVDNVNSVTAKIGDKFGYTLIPQVSLTS